MKVKLSIILILIFSTQLYSQELVPQKSIYIEFGGSAGLGSINYENIFSKKRKIDFLWRIGISGFPIDKNGGFVFVIPASFGGLIGGERHKFEFGLGQGLSFTTKGRLFILATPIFGYRFKLKKKPFYFRISYTPLISYIIDFQFQNWIGFSIAYNIN